MRTLLPDVRLAALTTGPAATCLTLPSAARPSGRRTTPRSPQPICDEAHALGLAVIPWTVNDAADMRRLIATGRRRPDHRSPRPAPGVTAMSQRISLARTHLSLVVSLSCCWPRARRQRQTAGPSRPDHRRSIEVVADGLFAPLGLAALPDGSLLVAEEGTGPPRRQRRRLAHHADGRRRAAGLRLSILARFRRPGRRQPGQRRARRQQGSTSATLAPPISGRCRCDGGRCRRCRPRPTPDDLGQAMVRLNNVMLINPFDLAYAPRRRAGRHRFQRQRRCHRECRRYDTLLSPLRPAGRSRRSVRHRGGRPHRHRTRRRQVPGHADRRLPISGRRRPTGRHRHAAQPAHDCRTG